MACRAGLEAELQTIETEIQNKEVEVMEMDPDLDHIRSREVAERKSQVFSHMNPSIRLTIFLTVSRKLNPD